MWRLLYVSIFLLSIGIAASQTNTGNVPVNVGSVTISSGTIAVSSVSGTVTTIPAGNSIVALDIATVTTGGTAVTALNAGHRTAGGWIQNPPTATVNLCINEQGTASGTTSSGATTCIAPGTTYQLVRTSTAVSVISSDSSHPFSGMGLN